MPATGKALAVLVPAHLELLRRPGRIGLVQQRQIEQPFAWIVDDIHVQPVPAKRAVEKSLRLKFEREAELAQPPGALRPMRRVTQQIGQMALIVETRHVVIGLRFEIGAAQPPLRMSVEEWQASTGQKIVNQGCYENGLAGA